MSKFPRGFNPAAFDTIPSNADPLFDRSKFSSDFDHKVTELEARREILKHLSKAESEKLGRDVTLVSKEQLLDMGYMRSLGGVDAIGRGDVVICN